MCVHRKVLVTCLIMWKASWKPCNCAFAQIAVWQEFEVWSFDCALLFVREGVDEFERSLNWFFYWITNIDWICMLLLLAECFLNQWKMSWLFHAYVNLREKSCSSPPNLWVSSNKREEEQVEKICSARQLSENAAFGRRRKGSREREKRGAVNPYCLGEPRRASI
jgi:hypothetical protein